jgi:hypothetical protein
MATDAAILRVRGRRSYGIILSFINTGSATVVFQVRSGNTADLVRTYTVEPGKRLQDTWNVVSSYDLSVYGPNGFVRYFKGCIGAGAAALDVFSKYDREERGAIEWRISNVGASQAEVRACWMLTQAIRPRNFSSHTRVLPTSCRWSGCMAGTT